MEDCKQQSPKSITLVLIGNKTDLQEKRKVLYEEGEEFAKKNGILFFETSAKKNYNIDEVFLASVEVINKNIKNNKYDLNHDVSLIKIVQSCGIKSGISLGDLGKKDSEIDLSSTKKKGKCC